MDAHDIIELLGLEPLPGEGGFFRETYRSPLPVPETALPDGYSGGRPLETAIFYLVTPDSFSMLHRVRGDEVFHFYYGDPAALFMIYPDGAAETVVLGTDLTRGHRPQIVVPGGVWQGLRVVEGGKFTLLGTTMAPGFAWDDYEHGDREELARMYPDHAPAIVRYTRVNPPD